MNHLTLMLSMALFVGVAIGQDEKNEVELKTGSAGGSDYDTPVGEEIERYGKAWVPITAKSVELLIHKDQFGDLDIRGMRFKASKTGDKLTDQYFMNYKSPQISLKDTKAGEIYLQGRVTDYMHKDRLLYYKIDDQYIPMEGDEVNLKENIKVDQNVVVMGPEVGVCKDFAPKEMAPFLKVEGFADLALKPLGLTVANYKVVNQNSPAQFTGMAKQNENQVSVGAKVTLMGIMRYKEKYFLKVRFEQDFSQGLANAPIKTANRRLEAKVGYQVNPNLSVNAGMENNEMVLKNNSRSEIDVSNIGSVGVTYKIPKKKKKTYIDE